MWLGIRTCWAVLMDDRLARAIAAFSPEGEQIYRVPAELRTGLVVWWTLPSLASWFKNLPPSWSKSMTITNVPSKFLNSVTNNIPGPASSAAFLRQRQTPHQDRVSLCEAESESIELFIRIRQATIPRDWVGVQEVYLKGF